MNPCHGSPGLLRDREERKNFAHMTEAPCVFRSDVNESMNRQTSSRSVYPDKLLLNACLEEQRLRRHDTQTASLVSSRSPFTYLLF